MFELKTMCTIFTFCIYVAIPTCLEYAREPHIRRLHKNIIVFAKIFMLNIIWNIRSVHDTRFYSFSSTDNLILLYHESSFVWFVNRLQKRFSIRLSFLCMLRGFSDVCEPISIILFLVQTSVASNLKIVLLLHSGWQIRWWSRSIGFNPLKINQFQ